MAQHFLPLFPGTLTFQNQNRANWPILLNVLEGHADVILSVAFSPDGKSIVSGSYDTTIRVWDAETGEAISGPFKGHSQDVTSVAFHPDGKRFAVLKAPGAGETAPVNKVRFIFNFFDELRRKVPTGKN